MIVKISFAVAALLFSGVIASAGDYARADIPFKASLECTACIRGGWNYCLTLGGKGAGTDSKYTCEDKHRQP